MPPLRHVAAIVENDESLDLTTSQVGDGGNASLPTKDTQPTYNVREEPLVLLWGKF